jgi:hypothetical protein
MKIQIRSKDIIIKAELFDNKTTEKIEEILPIRRNANRWGGEIYFELPVHSDLDDTAKEVVEIGDIGFWPSGDAFCIFFGKTPASVGEEIRPASAVNVIGKVTSEINILKKIPDGAELVLSKG